MVTNNEYAALLESGESLIGLVPTDGFFASETSVFERTPTVGFTNQRYIAFGTQGMLKKRPRIVASWPLSKFTSRVNSSEGDALGTYLNLLTFFMDDGEFVSAGFKREAGRQQLRSLVEEAFGG